MKNYYYALYCSICKLWDQSLNYNLCRLFFLFLLVALLTAFVVRKVVIPSERSIKKRQRFNIGKKAFARFLQQNTLTFHFKNESVLCKLSYFSCKIVTAHEVCKQNAYLCSEKIEIKMTKSKKKFCKFMEFIFIQM